MRDLYHVESTCHSNEHKGRPSIVKSRPLAFPSLVEDYALSNVQWLSP